MDKNHNQEPTTNINMSLHDDKDSNPSPTKQDLSSKPHHQREEKEDTNGGGEKVKRHRSDVAVAGGGGRVWSIPDRWGQEGFLKDWIDSSAFNSSLVPNGILSARAALVRVQTSRNNNINRTATTTSPHFRIQNRC